MPKKTPAHLQREIDAVLTKKSRHVDELEPLQESPARKAEWLRGAKRRFPVGSRVRVVKSDEPRYVGKHGTVIDYDLGPMGSWPLVRVKLADTTVDGFYGDGNREDEIVREGKSTQRSHSTKTSSRKTGLSLRDDVTELEYHRPPTASEIRFGEGATHYRTFPVEEAVHPGTRIPRKWLVASDDGLRYYR